MVYFGQQLTKSCSLIAVAYYEGQDLIFNKVNRLDSGAYLCIASNGVPPSVSKRILLEVECNEDFKNLLNSVKFQSIFFYSPANHFRSEPVGWISFRSSGNIRVQDRSPAESHHLLGSQRTNGSRSCIALQWASASGIYYQRL